MQNQMSSTNRILVSLQQMFADIEQREWNGRVALTWELSDGTSIVVEEADPENDDGEGELPSVLVRLARKDMVPDPEGMVDAKFTHAETGNVQFRRMTRRKHKSLFPDL